MSSLAVPTVSDDFNSTADQSDSQNDNGAVQKKEVNVLEDAHIRLEMAELKVQHHSHVHTLLILA